METNEIVGGYSLAEQVTGFSRPQLYRMVASEEIPHIRISSRTVRFRRRDLEAWLDAHAIPGRKVATIDAFGPRRGAS